MTNSIPTYPIFLTNLAGASVLVVGGGRVGERKIGGLIEAGARVLLISPLATEQVGEWAQRGVIDWQARPYQAGDLQHLCATIERPLLVFAATDQRTVNAQLATEAAELHILCNVADAPDAGDFHLPAVLRHDDLTVAVGTGGRDPARAKAVRERIRAVLQ